MKRHVSHIRIWGNEEIWVYRTDKIGYGMTSKKYSKPSEFSKRRVAKQSFKCKTIVKYIHPGIYIIELANRQERQQEWN